MPRTRLELISRASGTCRFYELGLGADLFGQWVLERRWGRIGSEGDECWSNSFATWEAAVARLQTRCREKLAEGYKVVQDEGGLASTDSSVREGSGQKIIRAAEELERLVDEIPDGKDSHWGQIVASPASACRHRRLQGPRRAPAGQMDLALPVRDDLNYRIRSRIFQLVGVLVDEVLQLGDVAAFGRIIREGSNATVSDALIRFIPKSRAPYLDFGVGSFFARDAALADVVTAMRTRGIQFLGHLVQLRFDELLDMTGGNRRLIVRIEGHLQRVGLQIHARAGWWKPPGG